MTNARGSRELHIGGVQPPPGFGGLGRSEQTAWPAVPADGDLGPAPAVRVIDDEANQRLQAENEQLRQQISAMSQEIGGIRRATCRKCGYGMLEVQVGGQLWWVHASDGNDTGADGHHAEISEHSVGA
jgi:hypothetical protein